MSSIPLLRKSIGKKKSYVRGMGKLAKMVVCLIGVLLGCGKEIPLPSTDPGPEATYSEKSSSAADVSQTSAPTTWKLARKVETLNGGYISTLALNNESAFITGREGTLSFIESRNVQDGNRKWRLETDVLSEVSYGIDYTQAAANGTQGHRIVA